MYPKLYGTIEVLRTAEFSRKRERPKLQATSTDFLASRSQRSARTDLIPWSVYHSGLVPRAAVRGRIRPTYFPFPASRLGLASSKQAATKARLTFQTLGRMDTLDCLCRLCVFVWVEKPLISRRSGGWES